MKRKTAITTMAMLLLCFAMTAQPQHRLARSVFGSGGTPASSGVHRLSSTMGQPLIGRMDESSHQGRIGFWYTAPTGPVGVDALQAAPPHSLAVINYPNPFRDRTTLRVSLQQRAEVIIEVHDILGRIVAVHDASERDVGTHDIPLDLSRITVRSGGIQVYFCKLTTDGHSVVRTMIQQE